MTSSLGVEHVEQQFLFHCSCGSAIEKTERKETCWNCGEIVELRLCTARGFHDAMNNGQAPTSSNELNAWLGQESGKPVHVATEDTDLTAELKRGLSFVRSEKIDKPKKEPSVLARKAKP
jgi:hypothetical protein